MSLDRCHEGVALRDTTGHATDVVSGRRKRTVDIVNCPGSLRLGLELGDQTTDSKTEARGSSNSRRRRLWFFSGGSVVEEKQNQHQQPTRAREVIGGSGREGGINSP